jgi:hypothetical protein
MLDERFIGDVGVRWWRLRRYIFDWAKDCPVCLPVPVCIVVDGEACQLFWVADDALELDLSVPVEPVVIKKDMYLCRSGEFHELVEGRIEAMLRRYNSRREWAPYRTRLLESQANGLQFRGALSCNLFLLGLGQGHARMIETRFAGHQIISIVHEGEGLLAVETMDGE